MTIGLFKDLARWLVHAVACCVLITLSATVAAESDSTAVTTTPAAVQAPEPAKAAASKSICKKESVLGSNIKKTTCKTQKQLDAQRRGSKDWIDSAQQQTGVNSGGAGG